MSKTKEIQARIVERVTRRDFIPVGGPSTERRSSVCCAITDQGRGLVAELCDPGIYVLAFDRLAALFIPLRSGDVRAMFTAKL
jgi:hypothetical protein